MKLRTILRGIAALAVTSLAVVTPMVHADSNWGPSRTTYTVPGPGADHPQFNSFTNNPNFGDERIFFDGKDAANTQTGGFQDPVNVTNAQELLLRVYVHNNANQGLNGADNNGSGVALNTKVRIELPTNSARSLRGQAFISASNAQTVFDSLDFTTVSPTQFGLSYVPGSAKITNAAHPGGMSLGSAGDSIVTTGAQIGYDQMNGKVPGCFPFESVVTIKVRVNTPSISLTKQVTTPGSTNWQSQLTGVKPGDTVSWLLTYKSTSDVAVNNVTIRDVLPAHTTIVPGSILWVDQNHPSGLQLPDTALGSGGTNVGTLNVNGSGGYIRFRTTINRDFAATDCNAITLTNNGFARAENMAEISANATAVVVTGNVCTTTTTVTPPPVVTPPPTPPALPATGPEGLLAGVLGTTGIGYSLRSYLRSKKNLISSLKK